MLTAVVRFSVYAKNDQVPARQVVAKIAFEEGVACLIEK
jgi:hypothetical protein